MLQKGPVLQCQIATLNKESLSQAPGHLLPEFDQVVAASGDEPLGVVGLLARGLLNEAAWHHGRGPAHRITADLEGTEGRATGQG